MIMMLMIIIIIMMMGKLFFSCYFKFDMQTPIVLVIIWYCTMVIQVLLLSLGDIVMIYFHPNSFRQPTKPSFIFILTLLMKGIYIMFGNI